MSKAFRIPKKNVVGLATWLSKLQLEGKETRMRSRFLRRLVTEISEIEDARLTIVNKYGEKEINKAGEEVLKTVGDKSNAQFVVKEGEEKNFQKELGELYDSEFIVEVDDENAQEMRYITDIILATDYKFGPDPKDPESVVQKKIKESEEYDVWATAVENL